MKIKKANTVQTEKWIDILVTHARKTFKVSVRTVNGKVEGNAINGLYTSYLTYLNQTSDKVKKAHFEEIKKYVERHIK
jgi:hypothetical protein